MDKYIFSALFEVAEEGGYTIIFPDLPGCITEADSLEEGIENAKEALGLHLFGMEEDNEKIPEATKPEYISVSKNGGFVVPVRVYMENLREELNNKSMSTTVTMPSWLKKLAEKEKINFSATLQKELKKKLGVCMYCGPKVSK